ncbi:MAG: hypothetical protein RRA94_02555 [Bacteroidota bacterium]|nr:hypothetical protein [Bacteroidota bacterium]
MRHAKHALFIIVPFILLTACSEDDPVAPQEDHAEAIGLLLYRGDTLHASILRGETTDTLYAVVDQTGEDFDVRFYDEDEDVFEAHDDEVTFSWEIADPALADVVQESGKEGKFEFRLRGKQAGSTTIEFFILHEGHADFRSGPMPLVVR